MQLIHKKCQKSCIIYQREKHITAWDNNKKAGALSEFKESPSSENELN